MKDFAGKVALVTGAAHGIGYAYAEEAAKRGMKLALVDLETEGLKQAVKDFETLGAEVISFNIDVSVYEDAVKSVEDTMAHYGHIDTLLANAGCCTAGSILEMPIEDWRWCMAANAFGVIHYVIKVLPIMVKQKTPCHIMITSSIAGLRAGMGSNPAYFASKHASMSVAESVKDYVDQSGDDIGVAVFCPMYVHTWLDHCEEVRPERFKNPDEPFYKSENYKIGRETFKKNIESGIPLDIVGPRLFKAIEEGQMYISTHTATIPYVKARHEAIEKDMMYERVVLGESYDKIKQSEFVYLFIRVTANTTL